jgi:hypothetical protein
MTAISITSLLHFLFITVLLGCGCAWLAGRAIALTWRSPLMVLGAAMLMALAVRFVHFALVGETLLAPEKLGVAFLVLLGVTLLAYRRTRALQMVRQYYWLYEPHGPLGWRPRSQGGAK